MSILSSSLSFRRRGKRDLLAILIQLIRCLFLLLSILPIPLVLLSHQSLLFPLHPLHLLLLHDALGHLLVLLSTGPHVLQMRVIVDVVLHQPQRGVDQLVCLLREVLLGLEGGQEGDGEPEDGVEVVGRDDESAIIEVLLSC